MNKQTLNNWLVKLSQVWQDKDPEAVAALLSEKIKYYESPLEKPITTKEKIVELWRAVPKLQENVQCSFKILYVDNNFGIANFKVELDKKDSGKHYQGDRIFLVQLDKNGLCTLFKQWREFKEG